MGMQPCPSSSIQISSPCQADAEMLQSRVGFHANDEIDEEECQKNVFLSSVNEGAG